MTDAGLGPGKLWRGRKTRSNNTGVTPAGIKKLQQAMPKCKLEGLRGDGRGVERNLFRSVG